ncbi:MAG TPA: hypothetical protein VMW72_21600 [Sedimentisphaerales bacterium]|nr:hypothetical protein [Sedimentisphaerales bacterium]
MSDLQLNPEDLAEIEALNKKSEEEREEEYLRTDPYELANAFFEEKYIGRKGNIADVCLLGFYPRDDMIPDHFYACNDDPSEWITDRQLRGEIAEYLHERELKITLSKINLILLCLQQVVRYI